MQPLLLEYVPLENVTSRRQRKVLDSFISLAVPTPLEQELHLAAFSGKAAELLLPVGVNAQALQQHRFTAKILSGSALMEGTLPIAYNYGGHQFGSWSGQLGDGRALSIGDVENQDVLWEISLKACEV